MPPTAATPSLDVAPDSLRQKSLNNRAYPSPYPPNSNNSYARPPQPGPSEPMVSAMDESKKDKRRREMTDRVARFADSRRDERAFVDQQNALRANAHQLYTSPNIHPEFSLRLYPISLERTANLNRIEAAEQAGVARAEAAYEEEQDKIEEEWRRQKDRLRERMLEAIEERRRKAREEKDGEGAGESILDPQSRPHATRNSRHGQGISTPTLTEPSVSAGILTALGTVPGFTTAGMALYPWALSGPPRTSRRPFPRTHLACSPNAYTVNTKGKRVKDTKTVGNMDVSVSKALAPARTGWTGGWGTGTTTQSNGGGPDVGAACVKLMGRSATMLAPAKSILDPQSRPHATRNSRHGQGISTPTLTEPSVSAGILTALGTVPGFTTAGMALYPWALSGPPVPEDLSSPFPLALTSLAPPNAYTVNARHQVGPAGWTGGWGTGTTTQSNGGGPDVGAACVKLMGRSATMLAPAKDQEIEADLNEIRRGVKRRRTLAPTAAAANR
ncbi:Sds3-like protein [Rhizoctonia solani]|uniref:Sds3-like protein n=1 Tax=Rhizoctonia solani TaxID=456999 RepID=A0A8H8STF7_9AGAM|nr:Sds3-like protein [Rhizoctonia solani]QRW17024.1 Sds3-like protein [Rhizoctonia solani]